MKLYTDWHGNWVGTQAEAKDLKRCFQADVPTNKPNLLAFLSEHQVGAVIEETLIERKHHTAARATALQQPLVIEEQPQEQQRSNSRWSAKDLNGFDIRDIAQEASLKDLTFAMSVYLNRLNEELS